MQANASRKRGFGYTVSVGVESNVWAAESISWLECVDFLSNGIALEGHRWLMFWQGLPIFPLDQQKQ
ncbi:MAG: hypothetical protein U0176_27275 [Bacteroidia bacterium]